MVTQKKTTKKAARPAPRKEPLPRQELPVQPKRPPRPEASRDLFATKVNRQLLFDCVTAYQANRRQGTQKAKSRGEVRGTTAKMYRQKGTGRARHGDAKVNLFVGGGAAFPPRPRSWRIDLPKKMKLRALAQALALRHQEGGLKLVDDWKAEAIKTKTMAERLKKEKMEKGLIVVDQMDEKLWKSTRNIPAIQLTTAAQLNVLDVLRFEKMLMTRAALQLLEKRLA